MYFPSDISGCPIDAIFEVGIGQKAFAEQTKGFGSQVALNHFSKFAPSSDYLIEYPLGETDCYSLECVAICICRILLV